MLGLADRVTALARRSSGLESRYSADTWLSDYLIPAMEQFGYGGNRYGLNMTHQGINIHEIANSLPGYTMALRACPPAFAAELVRALVMSQARFTFRTRLSSGKPKRTFGTAALATLERPWPNATTGEMIARMEWHAGLAGNSFVTNRSRGRLRVLRPDWVAIVYGSQQEPEQAAYALDGEVIGYVYAIGGLTSYGEGLAPVGGGQLYTLLPEEMAHWSPIPDPEGSGIGMSWLTPALRDMQVDRAATEHKLRFFSNGATPNLVIKGLQAATRDKFLEIVEMLEERHSGVANAFKTLYLTSGADATVVGSNFKDMDLKNIQGASETRVSSLSRVPASLLGIAEGLAGSSLNAGNFGMARRIFADTWVYPTLQDLAASMAPMVRVPSDADLWYDAADIPLLREDGKDAAEIEDIKATTITKYVREGFTAESSIAAVAAQDISLLKHTGNVSVQLQPPGTTADKPAAGPAAVEGPPGKQPPPTAGTRDAEPDDLNDLDEDVEALIVALAEFAGELPDDERAWSPSQVAKHPRYPKGHPKAGKFRPVVDRVIEALKDWQDGKGEGDPFKDFDRAQLLKAAKARGIEVKRGASRDEIADQLLFDVGTPKPKKAAPKKAAPKKAAPKAAAVPKPAAPKKAAPKLPAAVNPPSIAAQAILKPFEEGPFLSKKTSLSVHIGGAHIGAVHEDKNGNWTAAAIGARAGHFKMPPAGASKAQAIQSLVDANNAWIAAQKAIGAAIGGDDGLDDLADHQLKNLAIEYGLPAKGPRKKLIADLRGLGAVNPAIGRKRKEERDALDDRLTRMRRKPLVDPGPLDRAAAMLAKGEDPEAVAAALLQDAGRATNKVDATTLRLLATDLTKKAPAPAAIPPQKWAAYHGALTGIEHIANAVENGKMLKDKSLAGGVCGDTRLREYEGGVQVVYKRDTGYVGGGPKHAADAEQLASKLALAMGIRAPRIYRNSEDVVHMEYMGDAKVAHEYQAAHARKLAPIVDSALGRRVGLLDLMLQNADRHNGNWMVGPDKEPVVIDHGLSWSSPQMGAADAARHIASPFAAPYTDHDSANPWLRQGLASRNDLTKAEVAELRRRISALRPEFDRLGRGDWLDFSLSMLDAIGAGAHGKVPQLGLAV